MTDDVIVVITYQAAAGNAGVARAELAALIATVTDEEPDCHGIELVQDVDDETRFLLYERWSSRDAYTGPHMRTAHIRAFIDRAPATFAGPPSIAFWRPVPPAP
jgi:quinol monooxygenase YgiN